MMTPPPAPLAASAASMGDASAREDLMRPPADGAEAVPAQGAAQVPLAVVRRFEQALSGRSGAGVGEAGRGVSTERLADWLAQAWGKGSSPQRDLPLPTAQLGTLGLTPSSHGAPLDLPPGDPADALAAALALLGESGPGGAAASLPTSSAASAQATASQPAAWQTGVHAGPQPSHPLVHLSQAPISGSTQAPRSPSGRTEAEASSASHGLAWAQASAGAPAAASALASTAALARADGLAPGASPAPDSVPGSVPDSAPGEDADAGTALALPALAASSQGPGTWLPPVSSDAAAPRAAEAQAQAQAVWQQVQDLALRMDAGTGRAGVHQVRLDIDPRVLPGVQVTLQMMAGQVQVEFLCAGDSTRRRLRAVAQREIGGMAQRLGRAVEVTLRASGVQAGHHDLGSGGGGASDEEQLHAGV